MLDVRLDVPFQALKSAPAMGGFSGWQKPEGFGSGQGGRYGAIHPSSVKSLSNRARGRVYWVLVVSFQSMFGILVRL